jgi:DNA-binding Lrp family transcriptional regulator
MRKSGSGEEGAPRLDRLDIKILATLQEQGRITNLDLAQRIGLSATPCLQRVKRLESAGYIRGYGAELDLDRLCTNVMVFTEITLRSHGRDDFLRFERGAEAVPQLLNLYLVTGGYDYLAQFIAADIRDYQRVIERLLELDLGIEKYFSYVAIKQVKRSHGYPLGTLLEQRK